MTDRPDPEGARHDEIEARLHRAIETHTSTVEPRPGSLDRIEEALMEARSDRSRQGMLLAAAAAVLVALVLGGFLLLGDDDEPLDTADGTTTPTAPDDGTTEQRPTTTETAPPPQVEVDVTLTLFPDPLTSQRFTDPVAAALGFARDLVGMTDPVVGDFQQGDSRSGEVEVRAFEDGPVTLVLVRQLEDDSWFVIAARSSEIEVDEPAAQDAIDAAFTLAGRARAFEGTVPVRVLADGVGDVPATVAGFDSAFVTGSGGPDLGEFEEEITIDVPDGVAHGVVLLVTPGGEDGAPISATAVRVLFTT